MSEQLKQLAEELHIIMFGEPEVKEGEEKLEISADEVFQTVKDRLKELDQLKASRKAVRLPYEQYRQPLCNYLHEKMGITPLESQAQEIAEIIAPYQYPATPEELSEQEANTADTSEEKKDDASGTDDVS